MQQALLIVAAAAGAVAGGGSEPSPPALAGRVLSPGGGPVAEDITGMVIELLRGDQSPLSLGAGKPRPRLRRTPGAAATPRSSPNYLPNKGICFILKDDAGGRRALHPRAPGGR